MSFSGKHNYNYFLQTPDDLTRSLVLALGVCYQACLQEKRKAYRDHVAQHFIHPLTLFDGANTIEEQINR